MEITQIFERAKRIAKERGKRKVIYEKNKGKEYPYSINLFKYKEKNILIEYVGESFKEEIIKESIEISEKIIFLPKDTKYLIINSKKFKTPTVIFYEESIWRNKLENILKISSKEDL